MSNNCSSEKEKVAFGLLPHEARFFEAILPEAQKQQLQAQQAVGEANANSGGDWAFDDPATQFAAHEALLKDSSYRKLLNLYNEGMMLPTESYPLNEDPVVRPGSRVTIQTDCYIDTIDIVTRRIPGIPEDEANNISLVSVDSALGRAALGSIVGQILLWEANGRQFRGELRGIDQEAQRKFYTSIGLVY